MLAVVRRKEERIVEIGLFMCFGEGFADGCEARVYQGSL